MKEVIIAEKEEAAKEIARIIWGGYEVEENEGIRYFKHDNSVVVAARGHLLSPKIKGITSQPWVNGISNLPITNLEWKAEKDDIPRLNTIKRLTENAEKIIVATDYDREGEVIGYNILRYLGINQNYRMYYSALTEKEIINAYQNLVPMSESMLAQGLARNYADPIIGLNLTKALTLLYKEKYSHLTQAISLGRVQSPLLEFLASVTSVLQVEEGEIEETNIDVWIHYLNLNGVSYAISDLSTITKPINEIDVLEVEEINYELSQAVELFDTNTAISAIGIAPEASMNGLESLYLKGYATYPRTKSTHIEKEWMANLENRIRSYRNLPDEFSYTYTPEGKIEEKKQAIVLTEAGIDALFEGRIRGHNKIIADVILNQMIKSMACPLTQVITFLKTSSNGEIYNVEWSREIENLSLAIDPIDIEYRPHISPGKYSITSLYNKVNKREVLKPLFDRFVYAFNDLELIDWMTKNNIGTEATRVTFPSELRKRHYTIENNLPTVFGEKISEFIRDIKIDLDLTKEMENRIGQLENLSQLNDFYTWINELTAKFIENLSIVKDKINMQCDNGHEASLVNTKGGLLIRCDECNKFYRI